MKIRTLADGSIFIKDADQATIDHYNKEYLAIGHNRWKKPEYPKKDLRYVFEGKVTSIVGKGPSLDEIEKVDWPCIAINEAFNVLKTRGIKTMGIQHDASLKRCFTKLELEDIIFCSPKSLPFYLDHGDNAVEYSAQSLEVGMPALSVICAIKIAQYFGCREFKLYAFDSWVDKKVTYASSIGHGPKGDATRFLKHSKYILSKCRMLTLRVQHRDGEVVYRPQQ